MSKEPGLERIIKEYEPTDAQGVAEMWNACDPLWPDGFTAGVPFTAERIRLWGAEPSADERLAAAASTSRVSEDPVRS